MWEQIIRKLLSGTELRKPRIHSIIIKVVFIVRIYHSVNNNKYEKKIKKNDGTTSNINPIILFCLIPLVALTPLIVTLKPSSKHLHHLYSMISILILV